MLEYLKTLNKMTHNSLKPIPSGILLALLELESKTTLFLKETDLNIMKIAKLCTNLDLLLISLMECM